MNKPEIINRVANSALITIDLEDYYPSGIRIVFDIKDWLYESLVLREKEFRTFVESHDWDIYCSLLYFRGNHSRVGLYAC